MGVGVGWWGRGRHVGRQVEIDLGSICDRFGIALGSFWYMRLALGHSRDIIGALGRHFGDTLWILWSYFGVTLA